MRVEEGIQLPPIPYPHPYTDDHVLQSILRRLLPQHLKQEIQKDFLRWGDEIRGPIQSLGTLCDKELPSLKQYNQWGQRVDELSTSQGWRAMKAIAFREGLIAIAYDREKYEEWARVYMFAKVHMFDADGRMVMCPFSMTDGCARALELYGTNAMKRIVLPRLLSRDPAQGFTAGQWMTERPGGSDLSMTETKAYNPKPPNRNSFDAEEWELDGFKWFSSATDGDVALALARTGAEATSARSLSLFLVPTRLPLVPTLSFAPQSTLDVITSGDNTLPHSLTRNIGSVQSKPNNILIHRLKSKIGTWPVPTAELSLNGALAYRIGGLGQGVKTIAIVLNITRIHCTVNSVSYLARCLQIAKSYANVRQITNSNNQGLRTTMLRDLPLHTHTLAKVSVLYRALMQMTFGTIALLGRVENGNALPEDLAMLRLFTPLVKGYVATYAVGGMEECMVALGGQGYMEENGIGRMIRDALVEKIWEGTPNIMGLDVVRACRDGRSGVAFVDWGKDLLARVPDELQSRGEVQLGKLRSAVLALQGLLTPPEDDPRAIPITNLPSPILPRPIFFFMGHTTSALFLLEHAIWSMCSPEESDAESDTHIEAFTRWVEEGPVGTSLPQVQAEVERVWKQHMSMHITDEALLYGETSSSYPRIMQSGRVSAKM